MEHFDSSYVCILGNFTVLFKLNSLYILKQSIWHSIRM